MQANFIQEWPVADSYQVRPDDVLAEAGGVRLTYRPREYPELPFELAKLAEGDEERVLSFVSKWGELRGDETVTWYQCHAQHVAVCLKLIAGLQKDDDEGLLEALRGWLVPDDTHSEVLRIPILPHAMMHIQLQIFPCGNPEHVCQTASFSSTRASTPGQGLVRPAIWVCDTALARWSTEVAVWLLPTLVNPYLGRYSSGLIVQDGYPVMDYEFEDLLAIIYLQIAELAEKRDGVARCQECGAIFPQLDRRQRFCPPSKESKVKESPCSQKARYKKHQRLRSTEIEVSKKDKVDV